MMKIIRKRFTGFFENWVILYTVALILVIFFCISIYNLVQLREHGKQDLDLRTSVDIGIEFVLIFIGFFVLSIWIKAHYKDEKLLTKTQVKFFMHISPFLILTGITAMVPTVKRLEHLHL